MYTIYVVLCKYYINIVYHVYHYSVSNFVDSFALRRSGNGKATKVTKAATRSGSERNARRIRGCTKHFLCFFGKFAVPKVDIGQ